MSDSRLQSALREMQQHFSDLRVLAAIAIVGLLMGFAGPFGTYELLGLGPRLVYWLAIAFATYGVGYVVTITARRFVEPSLPGLWLRLTLLGIVSGLPITATVVVINVLAFGPAAGDVIDLVVLWLYVTAISIGVIIISVLVERATRTAAQPVPPPAQTGTAPSPALLERLPRPQRGPLLSLSVADHYVDVVTTRGHALVLIRLSDAIRETAPVPGLQIHRSHWVALDAVARAVRADGKLFLDLTDGRRLPVSRTFADAVRQAGFG